MPYRMFGIPDGRSSCGEFKLFDLLVLSFPKSLAQVSLRVIAVWGLPETGGHAIRGPAMKLMEKGGRNREEKALKSCLKSATMQRIQQRVEQRKEEV